MRLKLERPLIWFDVETHAFAPPEEARIIELGFYMLYHDDRPPKEWCHLFKPDLLITQEATEKHHITNEMVANAPTFARLASNLASGFRDCDFAGYNIFFDIRCLEANMRRAGVQWTRGNARIVDPLAIWRTKAPRTLSDAVRVFLKREPTEAHRASGDAKDSYEVFCAQLEKWPDLPETAKELHTLTFGDDSNYVDPDGRFIWENGQVIANFGKHGRKKTPLKQMPPKYLRWMQMADDPPFSAAVIELVEAALRGQYPSRNSVTPEPIQPEPIQHCPPQTLFD